MNEIKPVMPVVPEFKQTAADKEAVVAFCRIATDLTGVQLTEKNHSMVLSRLQKRVRELSLRGIAEYLSYYHAHLAEEKKEVIALLTTHHTFFFREFVHFEKLLTDVLPSLIPLAKARRDRKIRVWVAACSRGQEVYSLAMFLDYHLKRLNAGVTFEILGTDIDKESVDIAHNGVYLHDELKEVPMNLMGAHWARGTGDIQEYVKAKPSLRQFVKFGVKNLCELGPAGPESQFYDLIFCRNVFIYFNRDQIRSISQRLLERMSPEGSLFLGISETLAGLALPLQATGPSMYRHKAAVAAISAKTPTVVKPTQPKLVTPSVLPETVRVVCVDDSPVILTLLKKIFSKQAGFEVVGTAANGLEAAAVIAKLKPDAVTLDIHMPEQNGLEYLEKQFRPGHPPTIMVTSVSREDAALAGRALSLGACDYVEKPAMSALEERGEEIRNKVRSAILSQAGSAPSTLHLDQQFQKRYEISDPDSKLRVVVGPLSERKAFKRLAQEFKGTQPPMLLVVEGVKDALAGVAQALSSEMGRPVTPVENAAKLDPGQIYVVDAQNLDAFFTKHGSGRLVSILVFGNPSKATAQKLMVFPKAQLVLQDLGMGKGSAALAEVATDVVIPSSFAYLSDAYLAGAEVSVRKVA